MNELPELQRAVGRMEGKLDSLIDLHTASELRNSYAFRGLNTRVGKLESFKSRAVGWTAGISLCGGLIYAAITLVK